MASPRAILKDIFPEEVPYAAPNATPKAAPMPIPFSDFLFSFMIRVLNITA
jgi:hypothetical protein